MLARPVPAAGRHRVARHDDARDASGQHHRQAAGVGRLLDAGQRAHVRQDAIVEVRAAHGVVVLGARQCGPQRQHAVRHEPRIHRLHPPDGANQQPRRDQQHDRHRDLDRPRAASGAAARRPPPRAPSRRAANPVTPPTRSAGIRPKPSPVSAENTAAMANTRRSMLGCARDRQCGRHELREQRHRQRRGEHAGRAADEREHDALGQHLPHEPLAAGAERGAHGQLALASRRARQQQVGQVGAREQQHAQARAAERQQHEAVARATSRRAAGRS